MIDILKKNQEGQIRIDQKDNQIRRNQVGKFLDSYELDCDLVNPLELFLFFLNPIKPKILYISRNNIANHKD